MITDLFSHKIHSSGAEWPDKVVELAFLFSEFDGKPYNRTAIEARLQRISPRSSFAPRDPAKFRDEISAYPAYLGLFHFKSEGGQWVIRVGETTRALLCREEPDVAAFLRLQLALFQYPNGMGAAYYPGTSRVRLQGNARNRTLGLISQGCHLSPMRLITNALLAEALLRGCDPFEAQISFREIYALANHPEIIRLSTPPINLIADGLKAYRNGGLAAPAKFERRFHILTHTDLFTLHSASISFRKPVNALDRRDLEGKVRAISTLNSTFCDYDTAKDAATLTRMVASEAWSNYFDGLRTLPQRVSEVLAEDVILRSAQMSPGPALSSPATTYPLTVRQKQAQPIPRPPKSAEFADPEVTRVKRQRQSLKHKMLVDTIDDMLRELGAEPKQSAHIDLYAEIPNDGSILFEMKSGGDSFLDQVRKGLAQLYEYRFRYAAAIRSDVHLCLVLGNPPQHLQWLLDFLWNDRKIALCWLRDDGLIAYPPRCASVLAVLPSFVVDR